MTDLQSMKKHSHDVEVFWTFWPFHKFLGGPVVEFFTGYGWNWINTTLWDWTFWPRAIWNGFFDFFGLNPINWVAAVLTIPTNLILGVP